MLLKNSEAISWEAGTVRATQRDTRSQLKAACSSPQRECVCLGGPLHGGQPCAKHNRRWQWPQCHEQLPTGARTSLSPTGFFHQARELEKSEQERDCHPSSHLCRHQVGGKAWWAPWQKRSRRFASPLAMVSTILAAHRHARPSALALPCPATLRNPNLGGSFFLCVARRAAPPALCLPTRPGCCLRMSSHGRVQEELHQDLVSTSCALPPGRP